MSAEQRTCTRCCETKLIPNDFYTSGKDALGVVRWKTWCKQCDLETQKIKRFTIDTYKAFHDMMSARWQAMNPEAYRKLGVKWRAANPNYVAAGGDKKKEVIDLLVLDISLREKRREQQLCKAR